MSKLSVFLREATQVAVLALLMLSAVAFIVIRSAPTAVGLLIFLAIAVWMRGPLFIEEALWRARIRHRYLELDGCPWLEKVDEDGHGALYRTTRIWPWWEERLSIVQVCNHTPEPDGRFRTFLLRVPPQMTSAREAVAWTFGVEADAYRPEDES